MNWLDAIILGIVQGLTEFLPVSSSGHLVVGQKLLGFSHHDIAFDVVVHLGTLLAVLLVYKKEVSSIIRVFFRNPLKNEENEVKAMYYCIIATVPTAIIGLLFKDKFEAIFQSPKSVGYLLVVTGFILLLTRFLSKQNDKDMESLTDGLKHINSLNWWKALMIGFAQSFAIAPGISRSGSTIATAMILGVRKELAAMFSFMLSVPAILGATILQFKDVVWSEVNWTVMISGFISSFVFGYLGLIGVLKVLKKGRLDVFTIYLWILASWLILF